jgi:hypothetical protein
MASHPRGIWAGMRVLVPPLGGEDTAQAPKSTTVALINGRQILISPLRTRCHRQAARRGSQNRIFGDGRHSGAGRLRVHILVSSCKWSMFDDHRKHHRKQHWPGID